MDALKILDDNFNAVHNSFLYYLHEKGCYHEAAFLELCDCLYTLCDAHLHENRVSYQIVFIYGQVLKHIVYHFDPADLSQISNLPDNYNEKIEILETLISAYFSG